MPLSSQLARGLAPVGRRLLGMGMGGGGMHQHQRTGGLLGSIYTRQLAATAAAAAAVRACVHRSDGDGLIVRRMRLFVIRGVGVRRVWVGLEGDTTRRVSMSL